MIDDKTKQKLLKELEKTGNVYLACLKVGIDRSTHYRWLDSDKTFKKQASQAIRRGKENSCDIAKHALMLKVKDRDMRAIEYLLSHNDPVYKRKRTNNVIIAYKKVVPPPPPRQKTLEEEFDEYEFGDDSEDYSNYDFDEKMLSQELITPKDKEKPKKLLSESDF